VKQNKEYKMPRLSKIFFNSTQLILLLYSIYCIIFIIYHFLIPQTGEVSIFIQPNINNPEIQKVTITPKKASSKYYLLVYEDYERNNWIYYMHQNYNKKREEIARTFLPADNMKYLLLEGDKKTNFFSFELKRKYHSNYISPHKSVFHLIYLVPYKLFLFPEFYYCIHRTFYIDSLK
jgi:hypothetical protein